MKIRFRTSTLRVLLLAGLCVFTGPLLRASEERPVTSVKLSAPDKPATFKIDSAWATIDLTGVAGDTITVSLDPSEGSSKPNRSNGLRRLDGETSFELIEHDNVVSLKTAADNKSALKITAPRNIALNVTLAQGGAISVKEISGDLEIKNTNGWVQLEGLTGSAIVSTVNGEVHAVYTTVPAKLVAITSMDGQVELRVPAETKANVRLRTNNGAIFTDFDDKALKSTKEIEDRPEPPPILTVNIQQNGDYTSGTGTAPLSLDDITKLCADTIARNKDANIHFRSHENADPQRIADAMTACRKGGMTRIYLFTGIISAKATGQDTTNTTPERQRLTQIADEIRARRAIRQSTPTGSKSLTNSSSVPLIGGKIVTGTLNGGGVDIKISTMNGKITLRQTKSGLTDSATDSGTKDNITVSFQHPDNFTDAAEDFPGTTSSYYLNELRDCVQKEAARRLPAGSKLTVTFTDIDLAGMIRPDRNDVRFMTSTTIPRAHLRFQLLGADGQVLQEGERKLSDMNYQMSIGLIGRNEPLYYDKELLKDWIAKEFKPSS